MVKVSYYIVSNNIIYCSTVQYGMIWYHAVSYHIMLKDTAHHNFYLLASAMCRPLNWSSSHSHTVYLLISSAIWLCLYIAWLNINGSLSLSSWAVFRMYGAPCGSGRSRIHDTSSLRLKELFLFSLLNCLMVLFVYYLEERKRSVILYPGVNCCTLT